MPTASVSWDRTAVSCRTRRCLHRGATVGACTVEIAAFDEFSNTAGRSRSATDRLRPRDVRHSPHRSHASPAGSFRAPGPTSSATNSTGTSCLGPSGRSRESSAASTRPRWQRSPTPSRPRSSWSRDRVIGTRRSGAHQHRVARNLGIVPRALMVNGVFEASDVQDPLAAALEEREP